MGECHIRPGEFGPVTFKHHERRLSCPTDIFVVSGLLHATVYHCALAEWQKHSDIEDLFTAAGLRSLPPGFLCTPVRRA